MTPERVRRHDGASLAALVLDTIERANTQLTTELTAQTADLVPEGFDLTAAMSGGISPDSPAEPDEGEGPPPDPELGDEPDPPAEESLAFADPPGDSRISDPALEQLQRARSLLSGLREQVEQQRAAYRDLREELPRLRGHATALQGLVDVHVRQGNAISELRIADRALQLPKRLGPAVLEAVQRAQGDLAAQVAARVGTALPSIDVASMVDEYRLHDDEDDRPAEH